MRDCIFCKIVNKQIPADIVYEDDVVLAFNDIHPVAPVHILLVPKAHIASLNDIEESNIKIIGNIHLAIKRIAKLAGVSDTGYKVISNCGKDAGQTVFHLHYHIVGGKNFGDALI